MPAITIRLLKGRTLERKRELAMVNRETGSRIANGSLHGVHVIFRNIPRMDWGPAWRSAVCLLGSALMVRGNRQRAGAPCWEEEGL